MFKINTRSYQNKLTRAQENQKVKTIAEIKNVGSNKQTNKKMEWKRKNRQGNLSQRRRELVCCDCFDDFGDSVSTSAIPKDPGPSRKPTLARKLQVSGSLVAESAGIFHKQRDKWNVWGVYYVPSTFLILSSKHNVGTFNKLTT